MSNAMSTQAQGQPTRVTRRNYYDAKGKRVDRRDAEFFWEFPVRDRYSKDNPSFDRLLSQIKSPANEDFWAQRMNPAANRLRKQHDAQSGFWPFPRQLTEADLKADPGLLILGDDSKTLYLPAYNFEPLAAIDYSVFVFTLIMCNQDLSIDYPTIVEVWSTLVQKVYHLEKDDVRFARLREADFVKWTLADPGTSTATIPVGQQSEEQLEYEEQLKHEIAMLKGGNAQLKHKVGTLLGKVHSRGLKWFKSKRELTKV